jgi:hypothetical protein
MAFNTCTGACFRIRQREESQRSFRALFAFNATVALDKAVPRQALSNTTKPLGGMYVRHSKN